jgi:hypothetical protein
MPYNPEGLREDCKPPNPLISANLHDIPQYLLVAGARKVGVRAAQ